MTLISVYMRLEDGQMFMVSSVNDRKFRIEKNGIVWSMHNVDKIKGFLTEQCELLGYL